MVKIGFILGSGLVDCLDSILDEGSIVSNGRGSNKFGEFLAYKTGRFNGIEVVLFPRHGDLNGQPIRSPSELVRTRGYEANVWELYSQGVDQVYAFSAVGVLDDSVSLADQHSFIVPNDYLRGFAASQHSFGPDAMNVHTPMGEPFNSKLRQRALDAIRDVPCEGRDGGLYIYNGGDTFESSSEIQALIILTSTFCGDRLVGMTTVPELLLCQQMKMPFAAVCSNVNYAQGVSDMVVSHEQTHKVMEVVKIDIAKIVRKILEGY
ncbi:hypothetical protein J4467_01890 [Candidatus Woesearchaeota archaeon]|nr:hypothetical protein [Candidatus Woesearchaeota archaeon]